MSIPTLPPPRGRWPRWLLGACALAACGRTEPPAPAPRAAAPVSKAASPAPASEAPRPDTLPEGTEAQQAEFEQGRALMTAGDTRGAVAHFLAATEGPVTGTQVSASLIAADMLVQSDRAPEARALYDALLARAGHIAEVQFTAGRFFAGQEDAARAIEAFQQALRLQPEFLPAYPLLGALLVQTGRKDDAAQILLGYEQRLVLRLRQVVSPTSPEVERLATIDLLAVVMDERAEQTLRTLLADPSPQVRIAAASAVADQDEPEALVALAHALSAEKDFTARTVLKASLARARARATQGRPAAPPSDAAPVEVPPSAGPPSAAP